MIAGKWTRPEPFHMEKLDAYVERVMRSLEEHVNGAQVPALIQRHCDCTCGDRCPNGRVGSQSRCVIMVKP